MKKMYIGKAADFELYQAASGDYCVSIHHIAGRYDYNLGSLEKALNFIKTENGGKMPELSKNE